MVLAWRRTLRTETLASSACVCAIFTYSRRRSSVSTGMTQRMMLPSLLGLTPRSATWIAFSIACIEPLSNGLMMIVRASGFWKDASCCSGVGAP